MDYEKAYKEALERARYLKENADSVGALDVSAGFEYIFHELRESEDEKIRKELIRDIDIAMPIETAQRYIAWLEKQGEQNKQHLYDIIIALWNLLDKIDTFSDLQIDDTNPDNPFRKIEDITQERHKFVKSDGYNLFIENFMITNDKNFEKQDEQKPKVDLGNKFEWHNIPEETPKFGDTVIVACKNKNKEGGIWLYDLIQCWEGKWEPRENWETPLKWISVDELGLNARKEK